MKIEDLLNMDIAEINRLTEKQLRPIVKQMADAANKRLKRLGGDPIGQTSIAYQRAMKRGGNFSTK